MTKLSVIIPMYNVGRYVRRAAESVVSEQVGDWLEVIAVDDGSTDDTISICEKSFGNFSNFRLIKQPNTGPGGARNTGIAAATGEYIMFLDGDDFLLPNALQNILALLEKENPTVLFGRYLRWMDGEGIIPAKQADFQPAKNLTITEYILGVFPEPSWNSAWRYVCKRDFILENGLFFAPTMYCEDMKWVLELLGKLEETARKLAFLPEPFYAYNYRRTGSIMNSTSPKRILDLTTIIAEMLPKYRERPIVCRELIWQVFYYINEYCTFTKNERRLIFAGYLRVLPMFEMSGSWFYRCIGKIQWRWMFYWLSVGLFAGKILRRKIKRI
ncbi:MAG: glycosyltransferase [Turicibacter sp.]|nr:glycosyltransferase [Turicibacter sp.]